MRFAFVKGHGTQNDFIVLPDLDGRVDHELTPEVVAALCDRRRGIGADGVLRVVRGKSDDAAPWFMDYRNADGSTAQMCGNGIRVFARYLARTGLIDTATPLEVDTRDGVKQVRFCEDGEISVDMGTAKIGDPVSVTVSGRTYDALSVETGNPHAVVFVDSLDEPGDLRTAPEISADAFPEGVNVEFVVRGEDRDLSMRVYERGSGETRSCGTGACAAVVAAVGGCSADQRQPGMSSTTAPVTYAVQVPGGLLSVTWDTDGHLHLKGPAVLVAEGIWTG